MGNKETKMNSREKRLSVIKAKMIVSMPFYGTMALHLNWEFSPTAHTAYTDGARIVWDEAFFDSLTDPEVLGVCIHEILHVALGHCWRRDSRNPLAWNIACDQAVNYELEQANFTLPANCVPGKKGSAESLYEKLGSSCGSTYTLNGDIREGDAVSRTAAAAAIRAAVEAAKKAGSQLGDVDRFITSTSDAKVDWREVLHSIVRSRENYSWTRPNRRYNDDTILPSLSDADGLMRLAVCVDVSGSIDKAMIASMANEISELGYRASELVVITCDTEVRSIERLGSDDMPVSLKTKGGGGTAFAPALAAAADELPDYVIYITDGCGDPVKTFDFPLIWCIMGKEKFDPPCGEVIRVTE